MRRRRGLALIAAPVLMLSAMVATAPAALASCGSHSWSNKDPSGGSTIGWVALRSGPHVDCASTQRNGYFDYDCYTFNEVGNTWTHVRLGTLSGWIYDGNLQDGGSNHLC